MSSFAYNTPIVHLPSPRVSTIWLAAKGKNAESLAVLAALSNTTVDDQEVMNTFHGITDTLAAENSGSFKFSEIFTHGKSQHFRRTLLGMAAQCFQQICGIK